jgi:hypothetical protein
MNRAIKISSAKKKSYSQEASFVYITDSRREFFRFRNGRLVEYDLTRFSGNKIRLSPKELDAAGFTPKRRK